MSSLTANWLNEMEKLWKRRRTKGFLLLTLLIPLLSAAGLALVQGNAGVGAGWGSDLPQLMLGLFTAVFLPLLLFMTAADLFTGEAAARTLKLVLVRPIVRSKVFASKVMALAVYIAVHLAALWFASTAAGLLLLRGATAGGLSESLTAYAAACIPMTAIALAAVPLSLKFRSSAGALGLMVVLYAAARLLPFVYPPVAVWSVFSYTDWHTLWAGEGASPLKLYNTFAILLAYSLMAYLGGLVLFARKPV